jgi:hypothetical protein
MANPSSKRCCICKEEKPLSEFNKNKRQAGGLQSRCKQCASIYNKGRYQKFGPSIREAVNARRAVVIDKVNELKKEPCTDCGESYPPYVMDFDHLDDKTEGISSMTRRNRSWESILKEIAKCELVCSNCHRVRTHERGYV